MQTPADLITIDNLHLGRAHVLATYVLLGDAPALVDPGPASTLPNLEAGLQAHGLTLGDIRAVLLTHIHLDHAGATGTIVARNPQVRVYVHERGAPHMINPERLMSSALRIYGERIDELWGEMRPLPTEAVTTLRGGERVQIGGRTIRAYDAPGHARHHLIHFDETSGAAFVGDNCGVRMPGHSYIRPATPPPDIDLEEWDRTLDLLVDLAPRYLALTHFGAYDDVADHLRIHRERLHSWAEFVRAGLASGASEAEQVAALQARADAEAGESAEDRALYQHGGSAEMSWYGLARYWQKREH